MLSMTDAWQSSLLVAEDQAVANEVAIAVDDRLQHVGLAIVQFDHAPREDGRVGGGGGDESLEILSACVVLEVQMDAAVLEQRDYLARGIFGSVVCRPIRIDLKVQGR
jgi:hypothetical protein